MAYTPYYNSSGAPNWQNGSSGGTPINAAALNNMESGIKSLDTKLNGTVVSASNSYAGITVDLWYLPAAPNIMRLRISGTTTAALTTSLAYQSLWNANTFLTNAVGARSENIIKFVVSGNFKFQLYVESGGLIKIGYASTVDGNTNVAIPSGARLYVDEVIILK